MAGTNFIDASAAPLGDKLQKDITKSLADGIKRPQKPRPATQDCPLGFRLLPEDPFIGGRLRHEFGDNKEVTLEGDVGGFGVGCDFSWQVVATYGFDVNCFGTPLHTVIGYRALAVNYSEDGPFGENVLDFVQHGPLLGVTLRW